jgi:hypothetical protein
MKTYSHLFFNNVDKIIRAFFLYTTFIDNFYTKYSAVENMYPQVVVIVDKLSKTVALK